jgi:valyl-tRNA synthetase
MPLNTPLKSATVLIDNPELFHDFETLRDAIMGTTRIGNLVIEEGKPEVREIVVEVTPRMDKIGPEFKAQAPMIVSYLQSHDPQEISSSLENDGHIDIEGSMVTSEHLTLTKELIGHTGEKVKLILLEDLNLVLEMVI